MYKPHNSGDTGLRGTSLRLFMADNDLSKIANDTKGHETLNLGRPWKQKSFLIFLIFLVFKQLSNLLCKSYHIIKIRIWVALGYLGLKKISV